MAGSPPPSPPLDQLLHAAHVTLELCGYDADSGAFLLSAAAGGEPAHPQSFLRRELTDFQRWDRQLARASADRLRDGPPLERLPTRRLRKLAAQSWRKHDTSRGWRLALQKNVAASDTWLNAAFAHLSPAQRADFLVDARYAQLQHARALARADAQYARSLQQYFTSAPLVDLTLERVAAVLHAKHPDESSPLGSNRFAWLEPSCGDGRFVTALLRAGATRVVGVELDDALCCDARAAVKEFVPARVEIRQSDFLATTRASGDVDAQQQVVAIGNPPFGDKADGLVSVDLIQRFVQHAAGEWRAQLIAFIVPERCARAAYTELTLATLATCRGCETSGDWHLAANEPLEGYHFEFRGGKRIKQPSALLIYSKQR